MLSLLGALVLAGAAMTQTAGAAGTSIDQAVTEPSTSTEVSGGVTPADVGPEASEGATAVPGPGESPEVVPSPAAEESSEVVPAPAAEESKEVVPAPAAEESHEVGPAGPASEGSPEVVASGASTEEAAEGSQSPLPPNSQSLVARNDAGEEAAPGPPGALIGSLVTASTLVAPAEVPAISHAVVAPAGAASEMIAVQRARDLSCEFSALGDRMTDGCSTGSLVTQRFLSASHSGLADAVASLAAARGGSPPGGGHGSSALGSAPVGPTPGPAPGGASGSASGASGLALSGFFTLVGLLLLGAPRAMRRLRLSCQPWRTACFALIPERPG